MKVFAILTACAMAAAGATYGIYSYTSCDSHCGTSDCPVATTGGCCAHHGEPSASPEPGCCAKNDPCCLVGEVCCFGAEKFSAAVKPVEVEGCCEVCASPTRTVTSAAKAVADVK
jgi:hypothetical protein